MNTPLLLALALGAWLLGKKKPAAAATPALPPATPTPKVTPKVTPAKSTPGKATLPEILVTAPVPTVPLTTTQPVSAKAAPWPAVEQKFEAPEPAAAKRDYTPWMQPRKESGTAVPQDEGAAVLARERYPDDKSYWMVATKVSPEMVERANAILQFNWVKGGVTFDGPRTFAGRRMFRAVEQNGKKAVTVWQPKPPFVHNAPGNVAPAAKSGPPTLRQGAAGNDVAYLQGLLGIAKDGKFGPNTKAAVVAFQKSKGLTPDGVVGPNTWRALGAIK